MIEFLTSHWAVAVVVAPFIGSFLATAALRLPAGKGVVAGRSACPDCGHTLAAIELIPLVSWALARGRCRHCGGRIGAFYPLFELAATGLAAWAAMVVSGWLLWASCVLGWGLLTLAAIDARHMVLPDRLTLPLAAAGLAVAGLLGPDALRGAAIGGCAGFAMFAAIGWGYQRLRGREGLGMGDAKLLGAAGAWVGWVGLPSVVALAAFAALAVALVRGLGGSRPGPDARIPFGPYLCGAAWLVWLHGPVVPV